jgi:tRNA (guanine37-N1)-methyltransferase
MNKVNKLVIPFNMDARAFVRKVVESSKDHKQAEIPEDFLRFDHCYMNLPVDAVEFLDAFIGLFKEANPLIWADKNTGELKLPMIHVYGFTFHHEEA